MEEENDKEEDDSSDKEKINDEDMGGELEEAIKVKMELEKEDHKEDDKKSTKMKKQGKGMKCKHEESANQKKKENSKKAYIRRVQAYKHNWREKKEKREIPLPTVTT